MLYPRVNGAAAMAHDRQPKRSGFLPAGPAPGLGRLKNRFMRRITPLEKVAAAVYPVP